jgi:hypothetical protein
MVERIDTQTDSSFEIQATREQVATAVRLALEEHMERNNRFHPEYRLSVQMDYLAERTLAKLKGQTAEELERIIVQEPQIALGRLSDNGQYRNYVDIVIRETPPVCRVTISKLSNFPEIDDNSFRSLINFVGRQLDTLDVQLHPTEPIIDRQEKEDLPTPESLLETLPGERGEDKWWRAYFKWESEYKKKYKWTNRQGYELLAYSKSEYDRQKGRYKSEYGAL